MLKLCDFRVMAIWVGTPIVHELIQIVRQELLE